MKRTALLLLLPWLGAAGAAPREAPPPAAAQAPTPPGCHARSSLLPSGLRALRDCADAPQMIPLRGGSYRMGDAIGDGQPYERPVHEVRLRPFAIGRFEVTNAEWQQCVAAGACGEAQLPADAAHGRYPVAGVSWPQARAYAEWLAARSGQPYRLPSEAEWEYAARAGQAGSYSWGSFEADACHQANLLDASGHRAHPQWYWSAPCDDGFAGAAPVGSFPPNAWGLHDMLGNVWEWVADCWHADYSGAPADGSAWAEPGCRKYVNRGGGWGNNLRALRLANRDGDPGAGSSDGLGFRVARSLRAGELPEMTADTPAPPVAAAPAPRGKDAKPAAIVAAPPPAPPPPPPPPVATSLALERQLDLHLSIHGEQSWSNGVQHTQGSTVQDYLLSTRLRSDGTLYADNLLDADQDARLLIKQEYLGRNGLIRLKAQNGGKLPHTAEELAALGARVREDADNCSGSEQCGGEAVERSAALDLLRSNTIEDLEALIASPALGRDARWLYFTGYAGCPCRIHASNQTHIAGERAYNHARTHLVPWSLDRTADSPGSAEDRAALCQRYTLTIDIRSGDVYLENLYLPSPRGSTVRTIHRNTEHLEEDLPVPSEVLTWTSATLRKTRDSLDASVTLTPNFPLDGDSTPLGHFDGALHTTLSWSFKPVEGAPLALQKP